MRHRAFSRAIALLALVTLGFTGMQLTGAESAAAAQCTASVYGVLADGRLTYTTIDGATGNRGPSIVSSASLGFEPKAMATLNYNTILVTHPTSGALWRVDVQTNSTQSGLTFTKTEIWSRGWTHDKLVYDGYGHLYGTAGGTLIQYLVSQPKPAGSAHIGQRVEIGSGFVLKTLTSAGDDTLYATTSGGALLKYSITGTSWRRTDLASSGWSSMRQLTSPHGGLIYGISGGGMYWYEETGGKVAYHNSDPVDVSGWTQTLVSARPAVCGGASGLTNPHPAATVTEGWTPRAAWVAARFVEAFPAYSCYGQAPRLGGAVNSDHHVGNGIDCSHRPGTDDRATGDAATAWLLANGGALKIKYVIWRALLRYPSGATRPDSGHTDHIHISVL